MRTRNNARPFADRRNTNVELQGEEQRQARSRGVRRLILQGWLSGHFVKAWSRFPDDHSDLMLFFSFSFLIGVPFWLCRTSVAWNLACIGWAERAEYSMLLSWSLLLSIYILRPRLPEKSSSAKGPPEKSSLQNRRIWRNVYRSFEEYGRMLTYESES